MIRNQWYAVLESREVPGRRLVSARRLGEDLVFFRSGDGKAGCLLDRCVHRGVRLSAGTLAENTVRCPFHGLEYDASGRVTVIPANGYESAVPEQFRAVSYPTHEVDGLLFIWWGLNPPPDLTPPEYYENLGGMWHGTVRDPWHAHYSRVIENQLDAAHLPFVHHNTIGRGNRTLVDGPAAEWRGGNRMRVYVANRIDGPLRSRRWTTKTRSSTFGSTRSSFACRCFAVWSQLSAAGSTLSSPIRIAAWWKPSGRSQAPRAVARSSSRPIIPLWSTADGGKR